MNVNIGTSATESEVSTRLLSAEVRGSGSLEVYATPAMVALMEKAACNALKGCLDEGQTTVGTLMNIEHLSATPIGMKVTATATVTAVDGRKICFSVEASDEKGLIGRGTHERFCVLSEKFMNKTNSKFEH